MAEKKVCCIVIDRQVRAEAGRLGLNISRITELTLRKMIEQMKKIDLTAEIPTKSPNEPQKVEAEEVE